MKTNKKKKYTTQTEKLLKRAVSMIAMILFSISVLVYGYIAYTETGTIAPTLELFDGRPTFRFVDVGQGSCALVTYKGHAVIVDAGTGASKYESAEYIRLYAPNVDAMIITHPHEDHMGGAAQILSDVSVRKLIMRDLDVSEVFYKNALKSAKKNGTEVVRVSSPTEFDAGEIHIEIFDTFDLDYDDLNDASLVVRVTAGKTSVLFTGDAEKDEEALLVWRYGNELAADILVAGHHGSNTSSSANLLKAVSPDKCVISCGKDNSFGHPAPAAVQRMKDAGAEIYRTDKGGTVVLRGEKDEEE